MEQHQDAVLEWVSSSAPQVVNEFLVDGLLREEIVAGLLSEGLEVAHRSGIRCQDLQHLAAGHVRQRFFGAQDRQRAIQAARSISLSTVGWSPFAEG
jgi:hypothetical protein